MTNYRNIKQRVNIDMNNIRIENRISVNQCWTTIKYINGAYLLFELLKIFYWTCKYFFQILLHLSLSCDPFNFSMTFFNQSSIFLISSPNRLSKMFDIE